MPEPAPYRWRWLALAAVLVAEVMDLLDATVVAIAAPSIREDLGGTVATIQWIAAGYTLAFAIGLITGGRLGDLYGRRRMFLIGLGGFVVMSALCGLAVSPGMLIVCRVLQGLFGAILIPQGFGIIRSTFDDDEAGTAFAAFGPTIGLAAVCGPILAGALIAWDLGGAGWRTIFLINVPIGMAGMALGLATIRESRSEDGPRPDPVGMGLVSAGVALLVFPLVEGRELGWPVWSFVLMGLSVPVLIVFARHQLRRSRSGRAPLVEPALFAARAYAGGLVVVLVFFGAMTGMVFAFGLYLQVGLGWSALHAGLGQAPWALGIAVGSALSGAVLGRRYGRRVLQIGALIAAAGVVGMVATFTSAGTGVTVWELAPTLIVTGLGIGLLLAPLFDIVLAGVSLPMVGSGSGVLNAMQQLGATGGVAALGTIFAGGLESGNALGGLQAVLIVTACLIALCAALAYLLPRRARPGTDALPSPDAAPATA
ncbi:MFS transporter [Pseudonocardia endophytica]|uniref:EmrB/QacA subfamily drug resistance transporter n=1 Tax=Pseudonocardia endophytica TaxID=401976 RepID=A0A4R1HHV7_PSEEN|nr:MFS transporter [Pseudonocardia endophytica]TCK21348.1 EmrB/QacA subfamily drug resistance transporter [Pseudonocardia endophytica]